MTEVARPLAGTSPITRLPLASRPENSMPSMQSRLAHFPGGRWRLRHGGLLDPKHHVEAPPTLGPEPGAPAPPHAARTWDGVRGQLARGQHDVPEVEGRVVDGAEVGAGPGGRGVAQRRAHPADGGEVPLGEDVDEGVLCLLLRLVWVTGREAAVGPPATPGGLCLPHTHRMARGWASAHHAPGRSGGRPPRPRPGTRSSPGPPAAPSAAPRSSGPSWGRGPCC